mgnify:CR=1 FL=1
MKRRTFSDTLFYIIVYVVAFIAAIVTLYPFVYVVSAAFSDPLAVNRMEVFLWPVRPTIIGFKQVLSQSVFWTAFGNSVFYTVVGTLSSLVFTLIAAYPLSRRRFFLRRPLNFFIAFTMFFSGGLIPGYILITSLGLFNSRLVMIIPALLSTFNIMICRSAFSEIPNEMIESAQIDGANDILMLFKIAIPLIKPTIAVIALYYAVSQWNNFFTALLYLSRSELQPLQLLLRRILIMASTEFVQAMDMLETEKAQSSLQIRYVTIVVSTIPILIVYPFVQKYFVKGIMLGAIKG